MIRKTIAVLLFMAVMFGGVLLLVGGDVQEALKTLGAVAVIVAGTLLFAQILFWLWFGGDR